MSQKHQRVAIGMQWGFWLLGGALVACGQPSVSVEDTGGPIALERLSVEPLAPGHELSRPRSVSLDEAGTIFVSDEDPARIEQFDASGRHVRTIGRAGSGPGEFQAPVIGVGAGLIFVHDVQLSRLSILDTAGVFHRSVSGPCCRTMPVRVDRAGRGYLLSAPLNFGGVASPEWIQVIDTLGKRVDSILRPPLPLSPNTSWLSVDAQGAIRAAIPFTAEPASTVTYDGTLVYGVSTRYSLVETKHGPDSVRVLERASEPLVIPESARKKAIDDLVDHYKDIFKPAHLRSVFRLVDVPSTAPAFVTIEADRCGRLWVVRTDGRIDGVVRFDVFDRNWSYVGSASAQAILHRTANLSISRDRLAVVVEDSIGAPTIARFAITPSGRGCEPVRP